MSKKKTSGWEKLAIGAVGIIGGLILGKAISIANEDNKKQKDKQEQAYTRNIEDYDNIDELMTCPISGVIMVNPCVISECGHSFEKLDIEQWVNKKNTCPLCKVETSLESLKPNYQLKQVISHFQMTKKGDQKNEKVTNSNMKPEKKEQSQV